MNVWLLEFSLEKVLAGLRVAVRSRAVGVEGIGLFLVVDYENSHVASREERQ